MYDNFLIYTQVPNQTLLLTSTLLKQPVQRCQFFLVLCVYQHMKTYCNMWIHLSLLWQQYYNLHTGVQSNITVDDYTAPIGSESVSVKQVRAKKSRSRISGDNVDGTSTQLFHPTTINQDDTIGTFTIHVILS